MIEIVARDGQPQALLCPALVCDVCRLQVAGPGNIVWYARTEPERQSSPMFVAHKPCNRRLEAMLEPVYPRDKGWMGLWEEADRFIAQLAHNSRHPFAEDPDGTYLDQVVVQPGGLILPNIHRNAQAL
ncbi:hypothetical protein EV384_0339 [Micromonospora kangleipakensis]|uniref:Uncharacterized protein n=1 Tax=Micromonospora kangleipakensis TaxID=1077942 RepID=A0A4Q8B3B8_9ACTN|nr:hypothetical protein [Micromonospora kangleipakensis]RZU72000.1 hypothetical protein EV384_0339 [Micromonospora kangleipakensis]